jgi:hypothetical protein
MIAELFGSQGGDAAAKNRWCTPKGFKLGSLAPFLLGL